MARAKFSILGMNDEAVFIRDDFDNSNPTPTVTNDAEAVVAEVFAAYGNKRFFYRDTNERWDEMRHDQGKFTGFELTQLSDEELVAVGGPAPGGIPPLVPTTDNVETKPVVNGIGDDHAQTVVEGGNGDAA